MAAIIMWALLYIAACIWTMKRELQKRQKRKEKNNLGICRATSCSRSACTPARFIPVRYLQRMQSYAGTGLTWQCGKTEGGLFTDYARFSPSYEWASEFTWKIPFSGNGFIQPTLHFIQQAGARYLIGLLRFSYVLPTT